MIASLSLLVCLSINPQYHDACLASVRAVAMQSGFAHFSDLAEKYISHRVEREVRDYPKYITGSAFLIYQLGYRRTITIPLPTAQLCDRFEVTATYSSVTLNWKWWF